MRRQRSLAAHRRALQDPEEPACPQESSPPLPELLPLQNPAPQAAHIMPTSTHRAQPGAPGCSDPPPAFNLMKTNGGDNYP